MARKWGTLNLPGALNFCFMLRLALVVSMLCRVTCVVTIRNWTASTTVSVTPNPGGDSEDIEPSAWMQYTCTGNGSSGMFTVANHKSDNVVTVMLYDGQIVALVDNINDSIDGLLVDDKGQKLQTLFINL
jgi:hypothetical protein